MHKTCKAFHIQRATHNYTQRLYYTVDACSWMGESFQRVKKSKQVQEIAVKWHFDTYKSECESVPTPSRNSQAV